MFYVVTSEKERTWKVGWEMSVNESDKVTTLIQKHEEDLQRLRGFRLLDDDFMSKVFEDIGCTELLLRIILNQDDLMVKEVCSQTEIKNLQGRSVRLDIFATDGAGREYNIEVQRSDKGAVTKRARYNSSMIDVNITEPGDEYEKLPETYVIFITENDVLKKDLPLYHINRIIAETGELFGDGLHILYVNAQCKDKTALGKLMQDFSCTSPDDMNYTLLANRVRYFKEDEKGVDTMCKVMEDMRNETELETRKKLARRMLDAGKFVYEEIAEYSELSVEEVKSLDKG